MLGGLFIHFLQVKSRNPCEAPVDLLAGPGRVLAKPLAVLMGSWVSKGGLARAMAEVPRDPLGSREEPGGGPLGSWVSPGEPTGVLGASGVVVGIAFGGDLRVLWAGSLGSWVSSQGTPGGSLGLLGESSGSHLEGLSLFTSTV